MWGGGWFAACVTCASGLVHPTPCVGLRPGAACDVRVRGVMVLQIRLNISVLQCTTGVRGSEYMCRAGLVAHIVCAEPAVCASPCWFLCSGCPAGAHVPAFGQTECGSGLEAARVCRW